MDLIRVEVWPCQLYDLNAMQASGLQIMDQNRNALESWSLDVILEDSVSGRMQTAEMCDALITDILGNLLHARDQMKVARCWVA